MTVILDDEKECSEDIRAEWWCGYGLKFIEVDSFLDLRKGFLYMGIVWGF